MTAHIITSEDMEEVFNLIKTFRSMQARKLLKELPEFKEKDTKFFEAMKSLVRDQGRSNIIAVDEIEKLFVEYGGGE